MTTDMTAAATKQDLADLRQFNKQDLTDLRQDLEGKMESMEKRILLHFDFTAERFRTDLDAIDTEKIQVHSAEILQLQIQTGLRKA